jgi:hypothetical protein
MEHGHKKAGEALHWLADRLGIDVGPAPHPIDGQRRKWALTGRPGTNRLQMMGTTAGA